MIETEKISTELKSFASGLKNYTSQCESIILDISTKLPALENQVDDNIIEVQELLNFLFTSGSSEESYGIRHELYQFNEQISNFITILDESDSLDKRIFADLKKTVGISNKTIEKIHDIFEISESLKVFAINSIVFSHREGDAGKGYQIIASEFIKLSESISINTEKINIKGQEMHHEIDSFLDKISSYEEFTETHLQELTRSSSRLLDRSNNSSKNFSLLMKDLLSRLELIKEPSYNIMISIQKQDIIQQQMIHLAESLDDTILILSNNDNLADERQLYTLLDFLLKSTEKQILRINDDMLDLISTIEKHFLSIQAILKDIQSDREGINTLVIPEEDSHLGLTVMHEIFYSPRDTINVILENLNSSKDQKKNVIDQFVKIYKLIDDEKNLAMVFLPIMESINNLLLLGRIEQARHKLDLSGNESDLFTQISTDNLSTIIEDVEESHNLIHKNLGTINNSYALQKEKYEGIEKKLNKSKDILINTEGIFIDNYKTVMNISDILLESIQDYTHLFDNLKELHSEMNSRISICTDLHKSVITQLDSLGGALVLSENDFHEDFIKKIIAKYTVEDERQTMMEDFSNLDIEKSSGESVTLF